MHEALESIRNATMGTKFENGLWLVGGAVRDQLLGRMSTPDLDIVLEGEANELARYLRGKGIAQIEPVEYPRFGTALIRVLGHDVEIVGARKESYREDSRKPEVTSATLLEDARRRDFTVNTLLLNLHSQQVADPLGCGLDDLKNRLLRTPLDPNQTFFDDPLRMLRAIRFRWSLGFQPADNLYPAIRDNAHRLKVISIERIRDELIKMMSTENASSALEDLRATTLLSQFAPVLLEMVGVEQGHFHHLDVWDHTMLALRNANSDDLILNLALLLHDIAKPKTRFIDDDGNIRFFGHDKLGAEMAEEWMREMRFPNETIDRVCLLVRHHMRLGNSPNFTPSAARRLLRDIGDQTDRLLALVEADSNAHRPGVQTYIDLTRIREQIENVRQATPVEALKSPLDGVEVMEFLNIAPGPKVGEALHWLIEQVLEGNLQSDDKESAKAMLLETYRDDAP